METHAGQHLNNGRGKVCAADGNCCFGDEWFLISRRGVGVEADSQYMRIGNSSLNVTKVCI